MRALAVDDNCISLEIMEEMLPKTGKVDEVISFTSPVEAKDWMMHNTADLAFLDYCMEEMNGIELARFIRKNHPHCVIIMVSAEDRFTNEAYQLHIPGFIRKPLSLESINSLLDDLIGFIPRKYIGSSKENEPKLYIKCFGQFEVFDRNGYPVKFARRKAKEMFAFLVYSNGRTFTLKEIDAIIFGDEEYSRYRDDDLRNYVKSIKKALAEAGAEDVLYRKGKDIGIVPQNIKCDFYDVLAGKTDIPKIYGESFMDQYSWADGVFENLKNRINSRE